MEKTVINEPGVKLGAGVVRAVLRHPGTLCFAHLWWLFHYNSEQRVGSPCYTLFTVCQMISTRFFCAHVYPWQQWNHRALHKTSPNSTPGKRVTRQDKTDTKTKKRKSKNTKGAGTKRSKNKKQKRTKTKIISRTVLLKWSWSLQTCFLCHFSCLKNVMF